MTHLPAITDAAVYPQLESAPTYWQCEPSWSWKSRPLPHYLLWHVVEGIGHFTLAGRNAELGPGFCAILAPGDAPVAGHDRRHPLLVFGIHFTIHRLDDAPVAGEVAPVARWCHLRDPGVAATLARHCDTAYRTGTAVGRRQAQLALMQLIGGVWDGLIRPRPAPGDATLERIAADIRHRPDHRWSVPGMAAEARLSRAQFTRRFSALTGQSPGRYVVSARLERARQLLRETTLTVTQVATALGYDDVAYFSRQYKLHTGHSPGRRH